MGIILLFNYPNLAMAVSLLSPFSLGLAPTAVQLVPNGYTGPAASNVRMESVADLETLAEKLNPKIGFWDPLGLSSADFWGAGEEATVGFLRHAEIKHGRVAMAAFVGYCVQANGIHFPWALTKTGGVTYGQISAAGSPLEQWDALPTLSKLQIFGAISVFELFGEASYLTEAQGEKHYMMGGKPGFSPSIKNAGVPHPVPFDLYDPFGFSKNASPEKKAKGLVTEINNGRLAMLGIMSFVAEAKVPGAVPALKGVVPAYSGEVMAPFATGDSGLPFVADMLSVKLIDLSL